MRCLGGGGGGGVVETFNNNVAANFELGAMVEVPEYLLLQS